MNEIVTLGNLRTKVNHVVEKTTELGFCDILLVCGVPIHPRCVQAKFTFTFASDLRLISIWLAIINLTRAFHSASTIQTHTNYHSQRPRKMHFFIAALYLLDIFELVLKLLWTCIALHETLYAITITGSSTITNMSSLNALMAVPAEPLLHQLVVTPPEDGDRNSQHGRRKGRRVRMVEGLLAPPPRVSKHKKEAAKKRRDERKMKALGSTISVTMGQK
jgi:hypothetical protein